MTYKFRLYPTKVQEQQLLRTLETCCNFYNHILEQWKFLWERERKSLSRFKWSNYATKVRQQNEELQQVYSQVLQNVCDRVVVSFDGFFRRVKAGQTPGYPRFQNVNRYNSFTYPQTGHEIKSSKLFLGKIGSIKLRGIREMKGKPKTCAIRRSPTGKWYASIMCEFEPQQLPHSDKSVGIDVGIRTFAALNDGTLIENPRYLKHKRKELFRVQRRLSKAKKGSLDREKKKRVVSKVYEIVANQRNDFTHKLSRALVNEYGTICVEDINKQKMFSDIKPFNFALDDVPWGQLFDKLVYKAEWAGRKLVKVNPAYTSQDCSACGRREKKALDDRMHVCPCGLVLDRDVNAARNILRLGLQSLSSVD